MIPLSIPVVALGPGSHDEPDDLNYLAMPRGMNTYHAPVLPEPEDLHRLPGARRLLDRLLGLLRDGRPGRLGLEGLTPGELDLINQVLGEGEVSAHIDLADGHVQAQESVFAGAWRIRRFDPDGRLREDGLEVGDCPALVRQAALAGRSRPAPPQPLPEGIASAPALISEISERLAHPAPHVINLSLLPFTPEDGQCLDQALGRGPVALLSRGYGNCRVTATGVARVWWVQYFNSQDALILNTLELTDLPDVARAAPEDLEDSAERLAEVLEWLG